MKLLIKIASVLLQMLSGYLWWRDQLTLAVACHLLSFLVVLHPFFRGIKIQLRFVTNLLFIFFVPVLGALISYAYLRIGSIRKDLLDSISKDLNQYSKAEVSYAKKLARRVFCSGRTTYIHNTRLYEYGNACIVDTIEIADLFQKQAILRKLISKPGMDRAAIFQKISNFGTSEERFLCRVQVEQLFTSRENELRSAQKMADEFVGDPASQFEYISKYMGLVAHGVLPKPIDKAYTDIAYRLSKKLYEVQPANTKIAAMLSKTSVLKGNYEEAMETYKSKSKNTAIFSYYFWIMECLYYLGDQHELLNVVDAIEQENIRTPEAFKSHLDFWKEASYQLLG